MLRHELADAGLDWLSRLGGVVIAALPRRYWTEYEGRFVVEGMASLSGFLTGFAGLFVGLPSFLKYAGVMADKTTDLIVKTGAHHPENVGGALAASPATFVFWVLTTPAGWLTCYLVVTGVLRFAAPFAEAGLGDPILTGIDLIVRRTWTSRRNDQAAARRLALEGEETPDALVRGSDFNLSADYVLVASRRKEGWEKGVFVVTPLCWYRIEDALDRTLAAGLRTLYPLSEVGGAEVIRRSVAYELPRLSVLDRATRTTTLLPEDPVTAESSPLRVTR